MRSDPELGAWEDEAEEQDLRKQLGAEPGTSGSLTVMVTQQDLRLGARDWRGTYTGTLWLTVW